MTSLIPGNSPESILFEGHNLGNIIRYSPNAFLDDNADSTEIKIQYMMMRTGADYEIVAGWFSDSWKMPPKYRPIIGHDSDQ